MTRVTTHGDARQGRGNGMYLHLARLIRKARDLEKWESMKMKATKGVLLAGGPLLAGLVFDSNAPAQTATENIHSARIPRSE